MTDLLFKVLIILLTPALTALGVALWKHVAKKRWWEPGYAKVVIPALTLSALLGFFLWLSPVGDRIKQDLFETSAEIGVMTVDIDNPEQMAIVTNPFQVKGSLKGISSTDDEPKVWLVYRPVYPQQGYADLIFPQRQTEGEWKSGEYDWWGSVSVDEASVVELPPDQANLEVWVIQGDEDTNREFANYLKTRAGSSNEGYQRSLLPSLKISHLLKVRLELEP